MDVKVDPRAHAAIVRAVARNALADARAARDKAIETPTKKTVRAAFRACVLADRTLRKAADVTPAETDAMLVEAERMRTLAERFKRQLVRL